MLIYLDPLSLPQTSARLYHFKVTNPTGSNITVNSMPFTFRVSGITLDNLGLYIYQDGFFSNRAYESNPVANLSRIIVDGETIDMFGQGLLRLISNPVIPAGSIYYFSLKGDLINKTSDSPSIEIRHPLMPAQIIPTPLGLGLLSY